MKPNMKIFAVCAALCAMCINACTKWVEPECRGELICEKEAPELGCSYTLPLCYDRAWKAEPADKWLSVNIPGYVEGEYAVTVYCSSNESSTGRRCFNRLGHVYIRTYDHTVCDTIIVRQEGLKAEFSMENVQVDASQAACFISLASNLTDEERCRVSFSADQPWVESVEIDTGNTLLLAILSQTKSAGQEATVTMTYTPVWGESVKAECKITVR